MKLLYVTYIDTQESSPSGSSVRAIKMLEAFKAHGCEIMLLEGWNRKDKRTERIERVKAMLDRLETERPDACYVEVPAGPLFFRIDVDFLKAVHRRGIPLSIFYGDAYWRFPEFSGIRARRSFSEWLKSSLIYWMQRYDWRLYRHVARSIYFPSASMAAHFSFPDKRVSFPGSSVVPAQLSAYPSEEGILTGIYVGGASYRYGTPLMLEAFDRMNRSDYRVNLCLVCPQADWEKLPKSVRAFEESPWLERRTAFGDENLAPLYAKAHFACLPLSRNIYNDFAMSIKLFEYLAYHKPIISTDCTEMARFIKDNRVGVVSEDTVESYVEALLAFITDSDMRTKLQSRTAQVCESNTWYRRAEEVLRDFGLMHAGSAGKRDGTTQGG